LKLIKKSFRESFLNQSRALPKRKGSTGHLLYSPMEVYVSAEILQVLERIFETCVKWNI
jgi:hypothetical protein